MIGGEDNWKRIIASDVDKEDDKKKKIIDHIVFGRNDRGERGQLRVILSVKMKRLKREWLTIDDKNNKIIEEE